jgi:hypothetical protein
MSTLRTLAVAASVSLSHIHVECLVMDLEDVCEELSECIKHMLDVLTILNIYLGFYM